MPAGAEESAAVSSRAIADRIMVIEDDPGDADRIRVILERAGHRVTLARDGGQAQASFSMRRPDFVILDLMLPGPSGFEICESLKRQSRDTPVVILSVVDLEDARQLARRVGADAFLVKPIEADVLVDEVARVAEAAWKRRHVEGAAVGEKRVKFSCACGKRFRVSPVHRGRVLSCPGCGESVIVPFHD